MDSFNIALDPDLIKNSDFYNTISEIVKCSICHNILYLPKTCSSCENHFCKNCISDWVKVNKSDTACPFKCSKNEFKTSLRIVTSLLDKLQFKCCILNSNSISKENSNEEGLYSYSEYIKHLYHDCVKYEINCICNRKITLSEYCKSSLYSESLNLKDKYKLLKSQYKELKILYDEVNDLLDKKNDEISRLKKEVNSLSNNINSNNSNLSSYQNNKTIINNKSTCKSVQDINFAEYYNLYDKCKHFKGNYLPIFSCCDKSYPCYLCHQEENSHTIILSNKVICMNCKEIYTGNQCPCCNEFQLYKKKDEN